LHIVRNEWHGTTYPCVPGHEIIGRVTKVGAHVKKFKEGDIAGVGCMVDSCRECESCKDGLEQFSEKGAAFTCNSPDKHTGTMTYGGYSESVVVDEGFALRVPKHLEFGRLGSPALRRHHHLFAAAPLECWQEAKGRRSLPRRTRPHGREICQRLWRACGRVHHFAGHNTGCLAAGRTRSGRLQNEDEMKKHLNSFNFILDTVSAPHDINAYLALLKRDGTLTQVGLPPAPLPVQVFNLIFGRRQFSGSLIGGIRETQEMLDFCGEHNITCDIERIPIQKINEAYERLLKNDVKYRFVIDMASLK
jgi:alcohol dehydrogenase (NADP+)